MVNTSINYISHSAVRSSSITNFASAWQKQSVAKNFAFESSEQQYAIVAPLVSGPSDMVPSLQQSPTLPTSIKQKRSGPARLNKFVRRLHDMLQSEEDSGIVEWRKGLLVLHSTDAFTKKVLPKYFNTKNFKTFRRQLNYYGFVHTRSFSSTGSTTTALWVNQDLAKRGSKDISSVLMLKRVEPCEAAKTAEGRRVRKEEAARTVEDIGISTRALQMEQIRQLAIKATESSDDDSCTSPSEPVLRISSPQNIPSYVLYDGHMLSDASSPTPSLVSSPRDEDPADLISAYPTTDDAANLLIMFSKSAHMR